MLRQRIEEAGGKMEIWSIPRFKLMLSLPEQEDARPGVPRMNEVIIGVTRVKGIQAMIRTGKMAVHGTESRRRVQAGTFRYFLSPESSIFEISKKWRLSTLRRKD